MNTSYRVEIDGIDNQELADILVRKLNPPAMAEAGMTVRTLVNVPLDEYEADES